MNLTEASKIFDNQEPRKGYVTPMAFMRFMNEVAGLKLSKTALYRQLEEGKIRSLKTGIRGYQIPWSELEGDYEERLLAESQGLPTDPAGLLGTPVGK